MSANVKVSIITVVYNGANTIEQTIKSVIGQTYEDIEYIVIDGASADGTQQIIKKYADYISYYISEKDEGLYYAMNKGIESATGEIIGIINSDDWYAENAIKDIVECFQQDNPDLVYGDIVKIREDGKKIVSQADPLENIWYQMVIPHPSVFVKKSIYDKLGIFDVNYKLAADYEILLRFYCNNIKFRYINKVIAYFREGGISTFKRMNVCEESCKISMLYADKSPHKDLVLHKVKEKYEWIYFGEEVSKGGKILYNLLRTYFNTEVCNLYIFGTGIWGERCYKALEHTDIIVKGFSDNKSAVWDTRFKGIMVINPSELKNITTHVLIAVKEHGNEIKSQLNSMGNMGLKCVTISELKELYYVDKERR